MLKNLLLSKVGNKIKIVHIEDRFDPNMGYQINYLSKYHSQNFEMHIITSSSLKLWYSDKELTKEDFLEKDLIFKQKHGVSVHRLPVQFEKKHGTNILLKGVIKKIYELDPDVLFVHSIESYTSFYLLSKVKLYRDFLVCCDTHTLYNQFNNSFKESVYFKAYTYLVIKKLRKYNTPCFYTASENKKILIDKYGVEKSNVFPFLIGTDSAIYFPDKTIGKQLKLRLNIEEKSKIILYAGKFNYQKSPHLIIEALKYVEDNLPNTVLVMLGGKNKDYFDRFFNNTHQLKNIEIRILDAVASSELNSFYNMADLLVFPEENTLSALDCQLTETPLIMKEDRTNSERLTKGGLLYKPGDIKDLGQKIKLLLNNSELSVKMGKEGMKFISENYLYQEIIHKVEEVIEDKLK